MSGDIPPVLIRHDRRAGVVTVVPVRPPRRRFIPVEVATLALLLAGRLDAALAIPEHRAELDRLREATGTVLSADLAVVPASLTVWQVAEHLNLSERRVRELCEQGRLTGTRDGTDWRIEAVSVTKYAARRR